MDDVRGVLLDLDGTLLDHRGAADRAAIEWARDIGVEADGDPAGHWRGLEARFFPLFERGACSFQEQRRLRVRGFAPELAHLTDVEADAVFERYLALYRQNWRACPGAADLVERALAVCRVGVLTNGDQAQQWAKLDAIGLRRPGLQLFASSALGHAKPAARAFELACAGLGTPSGATVMVGDDYEKDVLGALTAGLRAVHVAPHPDRSRGEAVTSLREAADLLFGAI